MNSQHHFPDSSIYTFIKKSRYTMRFHSTYLCIISQKIPAINNLLSLVLPNSCPWISAVKWTSSIAAITHSDHPTPQHHHRPQRPPSSSPAIIVHGTYRPQHLSFTPLIPHQHLHSPTPPLSTPEAEMCDDVTPYYEICTHYGRTYCAPCEQWETCTVTGTRTDVIQDICPSCRDAWGCIVGVWDALVWRWTLWEVLGWVGGWWFRVR